MHQGTAFETERGISSVDASHGHALIVVAGLPEAELAARRHEALKALAVLGISLDFLKLSLDGFSFVVPESRGEAVRDVLRAAGLEAELFTNRSILTVCAVNIRDESGLVARIAQTVVQSGAAIESVGDMHSSVLIVLDTASAEKAVAALRQLVGAGDSR
ncbi:MAG: hypothetical protein U0R49_06690 [Fimbriimonadales bacterium]